MAGSNGGPATHARIGDDALRAKTGRSWAEWIATLDAAGARSMTHQEIASVLHEKFGVGPWWTQMVTVGYEQATGKRVPMQKADGYSASASRTLHAPASAAFRAFENKSVRRRWLDADFTIRKATAPKSLRITWKDGRTNLDVNIYPRGRGKAQVSLQHSKLGSARSAAQMKRYWRDALDSLEGVLAKPRASSSD